MPVHSTRGSTDFISGVARGAAGHLPPASGNALRHLTRPRHWSETRERPEATKSRANIARAYLRRHLPREVATPVRARQHEARPVVALIDLLPTCEGTLPSLGLHRTAQHLRVVAGCVRGV